MSDEFFSKLQSVCPHLIQNEPLASHTAIGIGGNASYFLKTDKKEDIFTAHKFADNFDIKTLIIGAGTNILISDADFPGLVIVPQLFDFEILDHSYELEAPKSTYARHQSLENSSYNTNLANSFNINDSKILVKVGSSFRLNALINKLNQTGITGLEWFYGIPGTVGGAVYMNIHGGNYFFADFIQSVELLSKSGDIKNLTHKDLNLKYDYSIFHESKEFILSANLVLYHGDLEKAKDIISQWGAKKILSQPQQSCGCIWQNLDQNTQSKFNLPTPSIGYIIDKVLNLKGIRKGDAIISKKHAAFIENLGNASFTDVIYLINLVEEKFQEKYHFPLKKEIEIIS